MPDLCTCTYTGPIWIPLIVPVFSYFICCQRNTQIDTRQIDTRPIPPTQNYNEDFKR
jgi:hypothetical protein